MTAIAYKDGVMAADESLDDGVVDYSPFKCRKTHGWLWGVAGNSVPPNPAIESWLFQIAVNKKNKSQKFHFEVMPVIERWTKTKAKFETLLISPTKHIFVVYIGGSVHPVYEKFWAIGSGREICMGAMAAGATAKEAVEFAIKYNANCKGKVRTVKL